MTCRIIEIGGQRLVAFDAPAVPAPEAGYRIDAYLVERKGFSQEFKDFTAAVEAYGDHGPETAELVAFAVPDPADEDKAERKCEWSNSRGWGKWEDD